MAGPVKKTTVKELAGDYRVSSDFYDALADLVESEIRGARKRARKNNRKTLMPHDL